MMGHELLTSAALRFSEAIMSIDADTIDRTAAKRMVKICARVTAVCAAAFVLLARDGVGPPYFDSIGKALFWTGGVFLSVFFLNQDVLSLTSGKVLAVLLSALQMCFVFYWFGSLRELSFIVLTPICFIECVLFMLPLMLIRRRHTGSWY